MGNSVQSTNWKLVSQYDNSGIRAAMKDMTDSNKMIAGMSMISPIKKDNPLTSAMAATNAEMQKQFETIEKLNKARALGPELQAKASAQKAARELADQQILAAMEKTRHEKNMSYLLREEAATINKAAVAARGPLISGKAAMIAQQVGFSIQDFSSQIETRGIGPAIGAITNNVQMLGMAFGPVAGAATAIGAAVGGIVLPKFVDWLYNTKQLAEEAKQVETNFKRAAAVRTSVASLEVKGGATARRKELQDQLAINAKLKTDAGMEFQRAQNKANAIKKELDAGSIDVIGGFRIATQNGAKTRQLEMDLAAQEAIVKQHKERFTGIIGSSVDAEEELRKLGPESNAEKAEGILKELELRKEVAKFNSEENIQSALKADETLSEKKKALTEEMAFIKDRLLESSDDSKRILERELGDRQKAFEDNERMIILTREKMEQVHRQDNLRKDIDAAILVENKKQAALEEQKSDIEKLASQAPNGSSAAGIRGTAAATSAINRAIAGSQSTELNAKAQLKALTDLLNSSKKIEQKLQFKKAGLGA